MLYEEEIEYNREMFEKSLILKGYSLVVVFNFMVNHYENLASEEYNLMNFERYFSVINAD